jgi:hypothetical protein
MVRELGNGQAAMTLIGQHMVEYIGDTIRKGGRNRPYAPLAPMTVARHGRTKPLITLADNFRYRAHRLSCEIYFVAPAGKTFDIDWHHRGYRIPARSGNPYMVAMGTSGGLVFFTHARAAKVPAREIWPSHAEGQKEVSRFAQAWIKDAARRSWR